MFDLTPSIPESTGVVAARRALTIGAVLVGSTMLGAVLVDAVMLGSPFVIVPLLLLILIATVWVTSD